MPLARVQEKSRTDLRRRCKELGVSYRGDDGPAALAAKIQYAEQSSQTQQQNAGARTEEPSSQITAVRASPPVGLDTHRSKPIVSTCPKRRRISTPPTKQPQSPGLCPSTARSAADELASAQGQEQPKGQGGIEKHSTAGTCSWLLLAAPGCSWLLSWLLLAAPGCSWLLLADLGRSWLLLADPRTLRATHIHTHTAELVLEKSSRSGRRYHGRILDGSL